jgi:hypothetical protein
MSNNKEGKKRGSWDHDFGEDWLILGFNYRWRGAREKKNRLAREMERRFKERAYAKARAGG